VKARSFWKTVVADRSDFLDRILALLRENEIRFCVVGGQAVNAYVEPLVSLDLDVVVAPDQLPQVEALLRDRFEVERFPHSLNVAERDSALRVQVQTDPRYGDFVARSTLRDVLGVTMPVADIRDVFQGKLWAASDSQRRASKRLKDLADIARLLEVRPDLRPMVPEALLDKLN
jgi:hypothetical protein